MYYYIVNTNTNEVDDDGLSVLTMSNFNNSKKRTAGAMSNGGGGGGGRGRIRGAGAPPASSCADGAGEQGISPDINIPLSLIRGLRRNMSSTGSVSVSATNISGASGSGNNSDDNDGAVGGVGGVRSSPPDVGGENSDNSGGSLSIGNNSFGFNFDSDEMNKIGTLPPPGGLTSSQSEKDSSTSGSDDAAKGRGRVGAGSASARRQEQKAVAGGEKVARPSPISSSNDGGRSSSCSSSSRNEVEVRHTRTDGRQHKQAKLRGKAYYQKSKSWAGSSTVSSLTSNSNSRGSGGSQSSSVGAITKQAGRASSDAVTHGVTESSGGSGGGVPTSSSSSSPPSVPLGSKHKIYDAPRNISCKRNTTTRHTHKSHGTDEKQSTEEPQQTRPAPAGHNKLKKTSSNDGGERSDDGSVGGYNSDDEAGGASTNAQTAAGGSEDGVGGAQAVVKASGAPAAAAISPSPPEAVLSSSPAAAEAAMPTNKSSEPTVTPTEGSGEKKRKEQHPPSEKSGKKQKKMSAEDVKREERNAREKERSFRISIQIDELRSLLSTGGVIVPKGTKSSVLTEAAGYIRMLQQHQYRSEIDRHQLVQQIQMIGGGALGPKAAEAVRHAAAKNGVWSLGNFGGMPPQSALTYPSQQEESFQDDNSLSGATEQEPVLDVRQIKHVEKHEYRHIFNSSSVAIAIASMGGAFIDCNKVFCQLSGYSKQELCSMTIFNLTARADLQSAFDRISSMITPAKTQLVKEAKEGAPIANLPPILLRGSMKRRDDLGISVNVVRGDDGVLKCFCVTLMKDVPASGFSPSSRPILATIESLQQVVDKTNIPMQDTIKKPTSAAEVAAPTYTAG